MATLREELLDIIIYERFEKEIEMVEDFIYESFHKKISEIDSAVHLLPYKESSNYTENTEIAKRELFEQNNKLTRMQLVAESNPLDVDFETLIDNRVLDISYKERVSSHVKLIEYLKGKADTSESLEDVFNKLHETDTNKEVDAVSEALDKVEKIFNVVLNVSEHKTKSAKELVDEIAKAMRDKGGLF